MNIFLMGGSGFIGKTLVQTLTGRGHTITLLSRAVKKDVSLPSGAVFFQGDPTSHGLWQDELRKHDVVINLVGASIFRRWTKKAKKTILESRIQTTRNIASALEPGKESRVTLLLNASAVGYYGFHGDEILDESSPHGDDFLASIVSAWESEARRCAQSGLRVVLCRFGLVMGRTGGALQQMRLPFKFFVGGPLGNGKQWMSWVHEQDLADMIVFLLGRDTVHGPVNCTSPHPVRNKKLSKIIGRTLRRPVIIPSVPGFMLRLFLGEFSTVLVKGQHVIPKVLLEHGFQSQFPNIEEALEDLLS
ncbi:MAG: TIGR01777 family oxidoreductase [Candidatus Aminicenantes bacterium]|nr:TIGR01777 family oxidoreductase [Candidatus Aminicenantes bacterium]